MKDPYSAWRGLIVLTIVALLAGSAVDVTAQSGPSGDDHAADDAVAVRTPASAGPSDRGQAAADWYRKGILYTVYGNDRAAIDAFKKVIQSTPERSDAHFQLGVSYGEIGLYSLAIRAIDQAIALNPDKSVYYYGRGRVHLLAGDRQAAMTDLTRAADMGHRDATAYLKRIENGM